MVQCKEPFANLITQGMVKSRSYRLKGSQKYIKPSDVYSEGGKFYQNETKLPVVTEWEKMSKSKFNGVDPQEMIDKYGCDTVRLMMLCNVGPASDRNWDEDTYPGIRNMQIKLFKLVHQAVELQNKVLPEMRYDEEMQDYRNKLRQERNLHLRHINYNYNLTRNLAVIIARVNSLINAAWSVPGQCYEYFYFYGKGIVKGKGHGIYVQKLRNFLLIMKLKMIISVLALSNNMEVYAYYKTNKLF